MKFAIIGTKIEVKPSEGKIKYSSDGISHTVAATRSQCEALTAELVDLIEKKGFKEAQ